MIWLNKISLNIVFVQYTRFQSKIHLKRRFKDFMLHIYDFMYLDNIFGKLQARLAQKPQARVAMASRAWGQVGPGNIYLKYK